MESGALEGMPAFTFIFYLGYYSVKQIEKKSKKTCTFYQLERLSATLLWIKWAAQMNSPSHREVGRARTSSGLAMREIMSKRKRDSTLAYSCRRPLVAGGGPPNANAALASVIPVVTLA